MSIKYQIFVSSTYEDLKAPRDQVIKAALEMGHIPVGMEMFSAADEEQWKIITRQIDQSDYYAVIVAHRYGSVVDGISYTEKEYDYAVSKGVPVIGFIIEDGVAWPPEMIDTEEEKQTALIKFKEKVKRKPVGFWKNEEDLHGKFSIALMKLITTNPRPGWARADELIGPEVMKEITRLSSENAQLRTEIESQKRKEQEEDKTKNREIADILRRNIVDIAVYRNSDTEWNDYQKVSLYDIFSYIAPVLISEASSISIGKQIALQHYHVGNDSRSYPIPKNYVEQWISDFACLKLLHPSSKKHSVSDKNEYWSLTELGLEIHADLRRLALSLGNKPDDEIKKPEEDES